MKQLSILLCIVVLLTIYTPLSAQTHKPLDIEAIDTYIKNHMAEHKIPGLALSIVHNDEIVYTQGYGIAGPDGAPVTPQTPFFICSLSKSFTALAIMQLIEAGKIDLDGSIKKYLPWFTLADPEEANQITIRHLLSQTSGISELTGLKDFLSDDIEDDALERGIRELSDTRLNRPVGKSFEYCNTNYTILGLIVQVVSGQSYEFYIKEHIFSPLDMTNSYTSKTEAEAQGLATGYTYFLGRPITRPKTPYSRRWLPAGGLMSSAEDMGHYLIAQVNNGKYRDVQILSPEFIALMRQPVNSAKVNDSSYVSAWWTKLVEEEPFFYHDGNSSNSHSDIAFSSKRGWGIVVLINYGGVLTIQHILGAPANEVLRIASGNDIGNTPPDISSFVMVFFGIVIFIILLNILFWGVFYWRRWHRNRQLRFMWQFILPLVLDIVLVWYIMIFTPKQLPTTLSVLLSLAPDVGLVLIVCGAAVALTALIRIAVYLAFTHRQIVNTVKNNN